MKQIKVIEKSGASCTYIIEDSKVDEFIATIPQLGHGQPQRTVEEVNPETQQIVTEVYPAEFQVEIVDLTNDPSYLLQQCYNNRREAYGPWESQLDEIFHDIDAWRTRINAIKTQFPKP